MKRFYRCPQSLLLIAALGLSATACDHHDLGPLGPLDHEQSVEVKTVETRAYVAPVDLELEWSLGNELVPAERSSEMLARIHIQAPEALDLPRPPARVVLVVDTSASMRGEAIDGAKQAAVELVDTLADGDSFSLVVFHSRTEVLMDATIIGDQSRVAAKAQIERMQAWGTTDLSGGLAAALAQLSMAPLSMDPEGRVDLGRGISAAGGPDPQVLERVVLLGDGVPNDPSPIPALAQQFAARGAEVTALGYGLEYDETMLAGLAEQTHGGFRFIDDPDAVASVFRDEVLHIQRTVAQNLGLGLALGPGVEIIEVVGHAVTWNPGQRRMEVALGSISEGQEIELMIRLAVGPHHDGATVELSDIELAYVDVHTGTGARFERDFLLARASADDAAIEAGEDRDLARIGARARTSAATLVILAHARAGQVKEAKRLLDEAVEWARASAKRLGSEDLASQAGELAALRKELASLARTKQKQAPLATDGPSIPPSDYALPPPITAEGARQVREAHSEAYNDLH